MTHSLWSCLQGSEKTPDWLPVFDKCEEIPVDHDLCPDKWEIPPCFVTIDGKLGEGEFGEVFKGMIHCELQNRTACQQKPQVAIKLLKGFY